MATLQSKERVREREMAKAPQMNLVKADVSKKAEASGVCPHCGHENESSSMFCEQCGARLRESLCPKCGAPIDEEADFCERCKHYIDKHHCSFCHGMISEGDAFCPDCGAPLSGIECPVCHTHNYFSFCEACGTPLTDHARTMAEELWRELSYADKLTQLAEDLERLWMTRPVNDEAQRAKMDALVQLRARVATLLEQEGEYLAEEQPKETPVTLTADELCHQVQNKMAALQDLLDQMATAPQTNPAEARSYAMACKPRLSRLVWKCNYKQALHTSPLGCACPQYGGKWIVPNGNASVEDEK